MKILEIIKEKENNIGSLILFINKRTELLNEIEDLIQTNIGENNLTISQKLWHIINKNWNLQLCTCGKLCNWIGFKNGWKISCGNKICYIPMVKKNNLEKYGVENPAQLESIQKLKKVNYKNKYGVEHQMKRIDIQNKVKQTTFERYGVEHPTQSKEILKNVRNTWNNKTDEELQLIKDKLSNTFLNKSDEEKESILNKRKNNLKENYGVEHTFHVPYIKEKIKQTHLERYGVDHPMRNDEIQEKRIESYKKGYIENLLTKVENVEYINHVNNKKGGLHLHCNICDKNFTIHPTLLYSRLKANVHICTKCVDKTSTSTGEKELLDFIKSIYNDEIVINDNKQIAPRHLDIYIPKLKMALEFNGLYWHNELFKSDDYHKEKSDKCLANDIRLIHIWEDDWNYKKDIVKSRIKNLFKLNSEKIFARKCDIREICANQCRDFLDENHLQGFINSKYYIALYYDDVIVSIMTFGVLRSVKNIDNYFEI